MEFEQLQLQLMSRIKDNIEESGEEVPEFSGDTTVQNGIPGFDSLRVIEVLIELESELGCELPPEKIFSRQPYENVTITDIATAIMDILDLEKK